MGSKGGNLGAMSCSQQSLGLKLPFYLSPWKYRWRGKDLTEGLSLQPCLLPHLCPWAPAYCPTCACGHLPTASPVPVGTFLLPHLCLWAPVYCPICVCGHLFTAPSVHGHLPIAHLCLWASIYCPICTHGHLPTAPSMPMGTCLLPHLCLWAPSHCPVLSLSAPVYCPALRSGSIWA